ncbi:MAG: hypothetical protein IT175_05875 [Acidobacteria bacterium]|jgi:peptidoglycan/LPS O-acetylase OafA/YrhL|nr:hypothetical protein [Acidobacteriota bacterium]
MHAHVPVPAHRAAAHRPRYDRFRSVRNRIRLHSVARLALSLALLAAIAAPALAAQQPGGDIFGTSDQTVGNGFRAFVKYMRAGLFLLGFVFLGLAAINKGADKPWGGKVAAGLGCWGFAGIGSLLYSFSQGEDVDLDTDLGS